MIAKISNLMTQMFDVVASAADPAKSQLLRRTQPPLLVQLGGDHQASLETLLRSVHLSARCSLSPEYH